MIKFLSSAKITVGCLFLLFVLTFWGTVAQVQQGLFAAQDRFFNSFFFLAGGFIPFPGAQLILWVFFVNLMASMVLTYKKYTQLKNIGLLVTHGGLIIYFVAAFMVMHVSQESHVRLAEGQSTNVSTAYQAWELAYWAGDDKEKQITSLDTRLFKAGMELPVNTQDFTLSIKDFYLNCDAYTDNVLEKKNELLNVTGITLLKEKSLDKERELNVQGLDLSLKANGQNYQLILFGSEAQPTTLKINGKNYYFILRHTRFPLPFRIKLDHFKAEFHPGTEMAKAYESLVTITTGSLERQVRIYMNNPLRYKDYTVYQASYDKDSMGRQYSTLAVVKNSARILPYVACLVVFLGLALHFLIQAFVVKREM